MSNPLIQIGDEVRPMTDEEYAEWVKTGEQMSIPTIEQVKAARLAAYEQTSDPLYFKWQRGDGTQEEWLAAVEAVKAANPYPPAP